MELRFEAVNTRKDIEKVAHLADVIWHEYWPAIIGEEQTDYMVENFQSADAMELDIAENNYLYFLLFDENNKCVGYTAAAPERFSNDPNNPHAIAHGTAINNTSLDRLFVSKIYLLKEERGKHYASKVIAFWEEYCMRENLSAMYLTVNRFNELGVRAYLGRGFETLESFAADIGNGFIMDDYIMAKTISTS